MLNQKKIEQFARQMHEAIPRSIREFSDDLEKKVRQLIQAQLMRMDIVTREEFDMQTQVLMRTREKLTTLEQCITELTKQEKTTSTQTSTLQDITPSISIQDATTVSFKSTSQKTTSSCIPLSVSTSKDSVKLINP